MTSRAPSATLLGAFLLVAATLVAYAGAFDLGFVYDDRFYVTGNARVAAGLTWDGVRWACASGELSNWHPLTWLSLMLDTELFGTSARGYHVTNVALHAANALLVAFVLARLTGAWWRSVAVAALFAVHPQHVESVAWISERKDVLSTWFGLLAIGAYARYAGSSERRRAWYAASLVAFAASLASKQMLVTLPFLLFVLDLWPLGRASVPLRTRLLEKLPFLALSIGAAWVVLAVQTTGGATRMLAPLALQVRLANACTAYATYLVRIAWPVDLAALYPHPGSGISYAAAGVAAGALALATVAVVAARRRAPYLGAGWAWFLAALVPALGIVQVGLQQRADRYTYVPALGIYVAVVWGLAAVVPRRVGAVLATGAVLALVPVTRSQVAVWSDGMRLFAHALAVTEDNALAHNNLAVELLDRGRATEAEEHLHAALAIDPRHVDAHYNLGNALVARGDAAGAEAAYRAALALDQGHASAHANLGLALVGREAFAEGIHELRAALRLVPSDVAARVNLANALARVNKLGEAFALYEETLTLDPRSASTRFNYGNALLRAGRRVDATTQLREAARLEPGNAQIRRALEELADG